MPRPNDDFIRRVMSGDVKELQDRVGDKQKVAMMPGGELSIHDHYFLAALQGLCAQGMKAHKHFPPQVAALPYEKAVSAMAQQIADSAVGLRAAMEVMSEEGGGR